ncbi:MAG: DUF296 domain-containing protein [bacterium]
MRYSKLNIDSDYIIKLEVGDKVHDSILDFCKKENIQTGWITGLGAIKDISLGYYNLETRKYQFQKYSDIYEVVGLVGNIALFEGDPFLHIHTSISDGENKTSSGHLEYATVAVTLELRITSYREQISRLFEDAVGLKLLQCQQL